MKSQVPHFEHKSGLAGGGGIRAFWRWLPVGESDLCGVYAAAQGPYWPDEIHRGETGLGEPTPIPEDPANWQRSASIVERNEVAATLVKKYGVAVDDLSTAVTPLVGELQNPNDVHFKPEGYEFLGKTVAASLEAALR